MRAASFSRRRARLRLTAPPRALLAVKPKRARSLAALGFSPRARACNTSEGAAKREPSLTYRNSARVLRRPIAVTVEAGGALQRPVKPTGAYAPWPCAVPAPCGRPWSPCGRGSRAAACGRAEMVDRCASRQISNGCRVWRLIGAATGQVNAEPRNLPVRITPPKVGEGCGQRKDVLTPVRCSRVGRWRRHRRYRQVARCRPPAQVLRHRAEQALRQYTASHRNRRIGGANKNHPYRQRERYRFPPEAKQQTQCRQQHKDAGP